MRFREGQEPSLLDLIMTNEKDLIMLPEARLSIGKRDHVVTVATLQLDYDVEKG